VKYTLIDIAFMVDLGAGADGGQYICYTTSGENCLVQRILRVKLSDAPAAAKHNCALLQAIEITPPTGRSNFHHKQHHKQQ